MKFYITPFNQVRYYFLSSKNCIPTYIDTHPLRISVVRLHGSGLHACHDLCLRPAIRAHEPNHLYLNLLAGRIRLHHGYQGLWCRTKIDVQRE